MRPYCLARSGELWHGDCVEAMRSMRECSVDTIITDSPYELNFMSKKWDASGVSFQVETWAECLRVAKPGAFLLAFGGTRTHHRLACAIEDAGWEIRDCCMWLYGSGFPKSHDVSKAIDKAKGVERKVVGSVRGKGGQNLNQISRMGKGDGDEARGCGAYGQGARQEDVDVPVTAPTTPEARRFSGYGTALKPSWEPIIVAMRPLDGSFSQNALRHGVAGLNIDGSRVSYQNQGDKSESQDKQTRKGIGGFKQQDEGVYGRGKGIAYEKPQGRWPANLLLSHHELCRQVGTRNVRGTAPIGPKGGKGSLLGSGKPGPWLTDEKRLAYNDPDGTETVESWECAAGCPCGHVWAAAALSECPECGCRRTGWACAVRMLDEQSGVLKSGGADGKRKKGPYSDDRTWSVSKTPSIETKCGMPASSGGASRFFYCSKSSRTERELGLRGRIPCVKCGGLDSDHHLDERGERVKCVRNDHPTIKPIKLMEYLCRLTATPKGGTVLDTFCGSGSTLVACVNTGRRFIGIDSDERSCEIAIARLEDAERPGRSGRGGRFYPRGRAARRTLGL